MPVFSFSLSQMSSIMSFPPLRIFLSPSSCSLKPSLITPPSLTLIGGSSTIAFSIRFDTASSVDILLSHSQMSFASNSLSISFSTGSFRAVRESDLRSLGDAVLYITLVISLSRSYIPLRISLISPSITGFSTNCSTAFSLLRIFAGLIRGCSSHDLSILLPIDVFVESITHRREPFFSLFLSVSVSSRFRLAVNPIVITGSTSCLVILENLPTRAF